MLRVLSYFTVYKDSEGNRDLPLEFGNLLRKFVDKTFVNDLTRVMLRNKNLTKVVATTLLRGDIQPFATEVKNLEDLKMWRLMRAPSMLLTKLFNSQKQPKT